MTERFENKTTAGNEKAIRRGRVVPEDAINLAYVKVPQLSPRDNIVVVDSSRVVEENVINESPNKVYYANSLGILEDAEGNQVVHDKYPYVTDEFSIDEDFSVYPGSEYEDQHVLPFVHVSRHFHLDKIGLTLPGDLSGYRSENIKVIDGRGQPYVHPDGTPRYRVKITSAIHPQADPAAEDAAYRVYVYVDTDKNEDLFLSYNKVELTVGGVYRGQQINYKEILNPQPVFSYRPEESEVADIFNRQKKIYSTKPVSFKDRILGTDTSTADGYKVYVPKKALADPRLFQLFHWRLTCDFIEQYKVDPTRPSAIRCGVIVTTAFSSDPQTTAPYALLNLERSRFNATGVTFENPLYENVGPGTEIPAKESFDYWKVDFNTVTDEQLSKFDVLLWAPSSPQIDFAPYNSKILHFVNKLGGTIIIDTDNYVIPHNFMFGTSYSVSPTTGVLGNYAVDQLIPGGIFKNPMKFNNRHDIIDGRTTLGGWSLLDGSNNDERESISYLTQIPGAQYCQRIAKSPSGIVGTERGYNDPRRYNEVLVSGIDPTATTLSSTISSEPTTYQHTSGNIPLTTTAVASVVTPTGMGYWIATADGGVYSYGDAVPYGSAAMPAGKQVVGIAATPSGKGYWLARSDGEVVAFGDAAHKGSAVGQTLVKPVVGMCRTLNGLGYWLVCADGKVFAYGNATDKGSATGIDPAKPIVGIASTATDVGYWLVRSDGKIYIFGDAVNHGELPPLAAASAMSAQKLGQPRPVNHRVVSIVATSSGQGYRLLSSDGRVYCYGDARSMGSLLYLLNDDPNNPPHPDALLGIGENAVRLAAAMAVSPYDNAYWVVATNGGTYSFGNGNVTNAIFVAAFNPGRSRGKIIFSTLGILQTCNNIYDHVTGSEADRNLASTAYTADMYSLAINSVFVEGAMKFLFNSVLYAVKGKMLDSTDERGYTSVWSHSTKWRSSWVIKPDGNVLTQEEKDEHDFFLLPRDPFAATPDLTPVWKRRLDVRTCKEMIDAEINSDPTMVRRTQGAIRSYRMEVSSGVVSTDSVLVENDSPYAFTEEYSPAFEVPVELGPHVIVAEEKKAQYSDAQYEQKVFPSKPYQFQVRTAFAQTEEETAYQGLNYTAYGKAVVETTITVSTPPTTSTRTSEVSLTWWDNPKGGTRQFTPSDKLHRTGVLTPVGIQTWQDENYRTSLWGSGKLNWPFYGFQGKFGTGSSGEVVKFIQEALNRFITFGYFSNAYLRVDGIYGTQTYNAVRQLQTTFGARYVDGVVDAETWSIIGYQIVRGGAPMLANVGTNHTRFFLWPLNRIQTHHITDGKPGSVYAKRSWVSGGPSIIWELFAITYDKAYNIHAVTLTPHLDGAYQRLMFRSIMVTNSPFDLTNFNSEQSQITYMPHRPLNGEPFRVNCGPYRGDTLVVGIGQDHGAGTGWGSARVLGLQDVVAHANVSSTVVTPGTTKITKQEREVNFVVSGTVSVESFGDIAIQLIPPSNLVSEGAVLKEVTFTKVVTTNPSVVATVSPAGRLVLKSSIVTTNNLTSFTSGAVFPGTQTFYSMDDSLSISPVPENGFISKSDGVKLFCDVNGKAIGFPVLPTTVGANELQRHYMKLTAVSLGTDAMVHVGFYDKIAKEFIVSADGKPEMSYIEYVKRGVDNIYVAAVSSYEMIEQRSYPYDDDAPPLPYRWAMPVYGLLQQNGARITLESLPPNLGYRDVWPVAVRQGSFAREVAVRPTTMGFLTTYLKDYQGTRVTAYYGLPEADNAGWSPIYGPPNADVVGESPAVVDDNVIRVRQAPILMHVEPNVIPSHADPVRPALKVYTRPNVGGTWVPLPWSGIEDYNVSTGEIILTNNISTDPNLVKVDYTTQQRNYYFKKFEETLLNLNPYNNIQSQSLIGKAIYIYVVPEYVKDHTNTVITASIQSATLRMTLNPQVFDSTQAVYDPLAVMLGVVYISPALDINDIALLDTRRRGGGASINFSDSDIARLLQESAMYWDVQAGAGQSYQEAGYVVVRLPASLKEYLSESEIVDTIKRNVTVGVGFKVEDLNGNSW